MSAATKENPLRIGIIGGGIAGLSVAVPLAQKMKEGAPITVHVYEAAQAFGEVGAGVVFGPNAQRVLEMLGLGDALTKPDASSYHTEESQSRWFNVRLADAEVPWEDNLIYQWTHQDAGLGGVHRADFLDSIVRKLPAECASFNKRLVGYTDLPGEPVRVSFQDGTTAEMDVLIGCDGIKSRVRRSMFSDDPSQPPHIENKATRARYSGWIAYRGIVPVKLLKEKFGMDWDLRINTNWMGRGKHIVQFPVRNGELVNLAMFVRDDEGKRAIGHDGPWTEATTTEAVLEAFSDYNEMAHKMIQAIVNPTIWGIFHLPELPWFSEGRVVLSGDAAHGTTPHQGAGAGMCVEDALILSRILTEPTVLASRDKIPIALRAFNHVRRPRTTRLQRTSFEAGLLYERLLPGCMDDVEKCKANMKTRMQWIWTWDDEQAWQEALDFLSSDKRN